MVLAHGGTVDKFIGDAVMGLFNTPLEQPDHARRAIEAALAIQESLPHFHQQFPPEFRMKINIGIHSGTAIVGNVGTSQIMDFTAVGDTVNIAARLQSQSHGGSVLASKAVRDAIGQTEHVLFLPIGQLMLKGRTQSVTAYSVKSKFITES
jgi:adenylate cyclase